MFSHETPHFLVCPFMLVFVFKQKMKFQYCLANCFHPSLIISAKELKHVLNRKVALTLKWKAKLHGTNGNLNNSSFGDGLSGRKLTSIKSNQMQ